MPPGLGAADRGPGPDAGAPGPPVGPPERRSPGPEMPNGLLPGLRGGRGAAPSGRPPGAGRAGIGAGPGFGVLGATDGAASRSFAAWAAFTAASCSALRTFARASAAATSMSWALAGFIGGGAGTGAAFLAAAAFAGGPGFAVAFLAPSGAAGGAAAGAAEATIASRNRRATGASTVLDADFTYSPSSWSLARTCLLSTPSSFASSCTRALPATALLTPRPCGLPASTSFVH
jgi:hypothetical protein